MALITNHNHFRYFLYSKSAKRSIIYHNCQKLKIIRIIRYCDSKVIKWQLSKMQIRVGFYENCYKWEQIACQRRHWSKSSNRFIHCDSCEKWNRSLTGQIPNHSGLLHIDDQGSNNHPIMPRCWWLATAKKNLNKTVQGLLWAFLYTISTFCMQVIYYGTQYCVHKTSGPLFCRSRTCPHCLVLL